MKRILLVLMSLVVPVGADPQVEHLFAVARKVNSGLSDYSADMTLKLNANLGIITYHPEMKGKYLYKKPNKHKLDIQKAPNYLKKYPNVFGFNLPQLKNFDSKVVDEVLVADSPCYHIYLKNNVTANNDIEHLEIYIDKANHTVPRYDTYYHNGHLFVTSKYRQLESFWVFERMTADYTSSSVTVTASADYDNYKFNQKLSDSLFKTVD